MYAVKVYIKVDIFVNLYRKMYNMPSNKLNKRICDTTQPKDKIQRLNDGQGLYLDITPQGTKYWRYRYRVNGKENQVTVGRYPEMAPDEARDAHMGLRKLVQQGIDPSAQRKEKRQLERENPAQTFREFALEWHANKSHSWCARHAQNTMSRLVNDIFPAFGDVAVEKILRSHVVEAILTINKRGAFNIAQRSLNICSQVFDYAMSKDKIPFNPAAGRGHILVRKPPQHFASIKYEQLPDLLAKLESYETSITLQTRLATKLLMLTFVRTKELTEAPWSEFDLEARKWVIPQKRMKKRRDHIVPLSSQAIEILQRLKEMAGNSPLVFPSRSHLHKTMSNNTILTGLKRMGYNGVMTGHGFRALAMTTIREQLRYPKDVIDLQLAHKLNDSSQPYDRSEFLEDRAKMMQQWANFLDKCLASTDLKKPEISPQKSPDNFGSPEYQTAEIIPLKARGS